MRVINFVFIILLYCNTTEAQLKFLLEDFEGLSDGNSDLKENGIYTYGYIKATVDSKIHSDQKSYNGQRALKLERVGKLNHGGWGKGIYVNLELDASQDYLNFYISSPITTPYTEASNEIVIELREDDSNDNIYQGEKDDAWTFTLTIESSYRKKGKDNFWELVSIPLNKFNDSNPGGDGIFNISYKLGKLFSFNFRFEGEDSFKKNKQCFFDFICFSKGSLPTGEGIFDTQVASKSDYCNLAAFSKIDKTANFTDIAKDFEKNFESFSEKKIGVIHFFQPFSNDENLIQYSLAERINKVIDAGYVPMVTLENHFKTTKKNVKQPNLYSILEGHYDSFFINWAKEIKVAKGTVLLRILHEFNGDWYPWCTINNDKNPILVAKTYRYIYDVFIKNKVTNVKFIWCPNSMSIPQESWNYIMDAYPGDEFVDYVGLDVYNGAGNSFLWKSFRKEGIENYFLLTQQFPNKPLLICETASRERRVNELGSAQNKGEWIQQMAEALKTDMSKIKLLSWFNETETFKINSSQISKDAYLNYIIKDDYFKSGSENIFPKEIGKK